MNISNLKISTRLAVGFGFVILMVLITGTIGILRLQALKDTTDYMVSDVLAKESLITEWSHATLVNGIRTMAVAKSSDLAGQHALMDKIKVTSTRISEIQKQLEAMHKNADENALYGRIAEARKVYVASREEVFALKKDGKEEEAKKLADDHLAPALESYVSTIDNLARYQAETISNNNTGLAGMLHRSKLLLSALTAMAVLLGAGSSVLIAWSLLNQLGGEPRYAEKIAKSIASGDLTVIIDTKKEDRSSLLYSIKAMRDSLINLVGDINISTNAVAVSSAQIASGNLDLSSRTEDQASALEETASTMEQLAANVKQNADNARQANKLAHSASEVANKGGSVVSHVVDTMGSINASSKKIVEIIAVIDSIAFQTNILALNAAVEAARAGEQGRGFAVVAAEVRNLAQRSAGAAKEIKALIGDSVAKVDSGALLVNQAGATMSEVVASVRHVADIIGEISAATVEQSSGIDQINEAIIHIDNVTQQNATLVEEISANTHNMQDEAKRLAQAVSAFKLAEGAAITPFSPEPLQRGLLTG
ncbi:MAG: methyl-accepting chemotaxis protein [Burkholderiales bacterium]